MRKILLIAVAFTSTFALSRPMGPGYIQLDVCGVVNRTIQFCVGNASANQTAFLIETMNSEPVSALPAKVSADLRSKTVTYTALEVVKERLAGLEHVQERFYQQKKRVFVINLSTDPVSATYKESMFKLKDGTGIEFEEVVVREPKINSVQYQGGVRELAPQP